MRSISRLLVIVVIVACGSPSPPSSTVTGTLDYLELLTGGASASDTLPLVVVLHGRGDTADGFARAFRDMPTPARVALLRAPIHEGESGDAWFTFQPVDTWQHVGSDVDLLCDRVALTVDALEAAHPSRGRPILTGFSQGAMITYAMALRHPDHFAALFPVSGVMITELYRHDHADPAHTPPIIAFHGTRDEIIPIDEDREAIQTLAQRGIHVELRPHDATHWLDGEMRADLWRAIAASTE
jgi:phospholipase/carboxylesterase